jgi:hypothetical protein
MLIRGLCGFLALFTLFMLTLSLIFTFGGDAPNLFGHNVYIIRTDRVEALKPGTALMTRVVYPEELQPGDIIIFRNSENRKGLAEIVSSQESEGVFRFNAVSERGTDMILTESQIVGKATHQSEFLGALINFAKSPAGVMVIAVIPCVAILIYEASKSILGVFGKGRGGQVVPVRKQDENPTYIPRQKISAAINAYSKTEKKAEDSFGDTDGFEGDYFEDRDDYPLFKAPSPKPKPVKEEKKRHVPLSQKRLNDAIAEVKAKKETNLSATGELSDLKEVTAKASSLEAVKRYTPKKAAAVRLSQTASIPSLDKLLREDDPEVENTRYDIENILFSIDKKK